MLTGKKFKLQRGTLALTMVDGRRRSITVPAGAIIKVVSGPSSDKDRMIDVSWDGQIVEMFAVDVDVRGTEIVERDQLDDLSAQA